ncbi:MAG: hypothetical protein Q9197_005653 [Variospora fuerteventurae]
MHQFLADTKDGGFSKWLNGLSWAGSAEQSEIWKPTAEVNQPKTKDGNEVLRCYCQCRGVQFTITRPNKDSSNVSSPMPDVLVPSHLQSTQASPSSTWWLRASGTKFLAAWVFVPKTNVRQLDGNEVDYKMGTLKRYSHSKGAYRDFCGTCGATVFWHCDERPGIVDVSAGLLDAEEGARAEDWLEWATEKVSFEECAQNKALVASNKAMATTISAASRVRGSIYGVAACDALGSPVEFCRRGTFPPVTGLRPNSNFDLPPGCWTDDTSMTLCLAQSLIDNKGAFVPQDQVQKYIRWFNKGYMSSIGKCFDIGTATRKALSMWKQHLKHGAGGEEEMMKRGQDDVDKALKKKAACGNGSLMRVSPIGLVFHGDPVKALEYAARSSEVTHPYPTNGEACEAYTKLIVSTFADASKEELAAMIAHWTFEDPDLKSRFEKYSGLESWQKVKAAQISSSGYVVHSLEASLWAFFTTSSFEDGALKVVNLGDDADTVGAIYGGIAGAFYGVEALPSSWREGLKAKSTIDEVITGLVDLITPG